MAEKFPINRIITALKKGPQAICEIRGSSEYPAVSGRVLFYKIADGVLVLANVAGLPDINHSGFYGFHIHSGNDCNGTEQDPFANSLTHYNPSSTAHPEHAGDLPPLLGNHGFAFQAFYTERLDRKSTRLNSSHD